MKRTKRRRWARFALGATLTRDQTREHGPEPHPELHARCRNCGRRWPEHDELFGACPDTIDVPEDFALTGEHNARSVLPIP